jgi:MYXO-CTERM domain-containing protein
MFDLVQPSTLDLYISNTLTGSYTVVTGPGGAANAPSVQIRFQATDIMPTTSRSIHSAPPATVTVTATSPGLSTTATSSPGLSTGAKAGVSVGVIIGVLTLLLLGALLVRRRRRRRKPIADQTPYGVGTKQELDGNNFVTPRVRDTASHIAELDASEHLSDVTSSQQGTRIRDSTGPSPLAAPHARSEDVVEQPGPAASSEGVSSAADAQERVGDGPERGSAAPPPQDAGLGEGEEQDGIRRQIKRIREEKERLSRINELERMEAQLEERLAGPSSTGQ